MRLVQLPCFLFLASTCLVNPFVVFVPIRSNIAGPFYEHTFREPLHRRLVQGSSSPSEGASGGLALGDTRERDSWVRDRDSARVKKVTLFKPPTTLFGASFWLVPQGVCRLFSVFARP